MRHIGTPMSIHSKNVCYEIRLHQHEPTTPVISRDLSVQARIDYRHFNALCSRRTRGWTSNVDEYSNGFRSPNFALKLESKVDFADLASLKTPVASQRQERTRMRCRQPWRTLLHYRLRRIRFSSSPQAPRIFRAHRSDPRSGFSH